MAAFNPALAPVVAEPGDDGADSAPLIVEEITPKSIGENSDIRISGRVTNTTDSELGGISVRFRYSSSPFSARSELDDFASGDGIRPETEAAEVELDGPLKPGASTEYTLQADASDLAMSSWGVYPLTVEALDGSGGNLGKQRTFLPFRGGSANPPPVDIAWVWPLMDRPHRAYDNTFLDETLPESLGPDGRLGRLLTIGAQDDEVSLDPEAPEAPAEEVSPSPPETPPSTSPSASADASAGGAGDQQGDQGSGSAQDSGSATAEDSGVPVTWAVDPGLLADIQRLTSPYKVVDEPAAGSGSGNGGTADDSGIATASAGASPNARIWLDQARAALAEDPLVTTPYASADIAALLRHDLGDDADAAVSVGRETTEQVLGRSVDETVALPEGGLMNTDTREFFQRHGASTFVLRDRAMPAQPGVDYTPTAEAPLPLGKGEHGTALVADSGLAKVLRQDTAAPGESTLAQQRFAAETAMIAGEDPGFGRTLLAYPSSDWDPDADFAQGVLEASDSLPWLEPVELSDARPEDGAQSEDRESLTYPKSGTRSELDGSYLDKIEDVRGRVRLFNSILVDGGDPFRPAILRLESAAWRRKNESARPARALVDQAVERHMNKVRISPTEPVTLASATGTIGVLIANDLKNHTVRVNLSLLSGNPERLSIGNYKDTIEIGPGAKTTVYVPLSARVNGRTMIQMNLHNLSGEPISEVQYLSVNATGMGSQALVISGLGALVLVVALAPRALRKWARNRSGGESAAAAGAEPAEDGGGTQEPAGDSAETPGADGDSAAGMQHNEGESTSSPSADGSASAPPEEGEDPSDGSGAGR
ncbi:hypothetical protein GCM10027570_18150 [Streptomonospora sediminis]